VLKAASGVSLPILRITRIANHECGLLEVAFVAWGNVATMLALLITIISGYMVVAWVAGEK
jgi:hypothetical protein